MSVHSTVGSYALHQTWYVGNHLMHLEVKTQAQGAVCRTPNTALGKLFESGHKGHTANMSVKFW